MPYRTRPRMLHVTLKPLQLVGCIAAGLWLGVMAILLTGWLLFKLGVDTPLPLTHAAPSASVPAPPPLPPEGETQMFQQYKDTLRKQEQQQADDQARSDGRALASPKCQFWLQQDQTAPSEKSRANVLKFCN
ncbi:hypothetical protein [Pseudomonas abieticivorans]|uniref:hypothetical protein n=1 Tax=Pseudomonas abieticivorans TaxID=2931382 RepID=UPI0020BEFDC1|nr:hypothetical protein [Pseudomonas sp. PIA16]